MSPMEREPDGGPVVTLDGPAGSGKSTTARAVAERLGFRHLDSGSLYRALTYALLDQGVEPEVWPGLTADDLDGLGITLEPTDEGFRILLEGRVIPDAALRTPRVTARVSQLASLAPVRDWLLGVQRRAGAFGRVVADGRDMGTVVFPDAAVKIFLTADLEERARRRLEQEGTASPGSEAVAAEARRLEERDRRDREREASPLRVPDEARILDTTPLSFEEQVDAIVEMVRNSLAG